jgi:hypothetical protein
METGSSPQNIFCAADFAAAQGAGIVRMGLWEKKALSHWPLAIRSEKAECLPYRMV